MIMTYKKTFYHLSLCIGILLIFLVYILFSCEKLEPERIMKVQTDSVTDITSNSCTAWGTINDLGYGVTQHGNCYAKTPNVSVSSLKTTLGIPVSKASFA